MASKKKHHKTKFKAKQPKPASVPRPPAPDAAATPLAAIVTAPVRASGEMAHLNLIKHDVTRVVILASAFAALELVLWYAFGHTSLGNSIYSLIKL